MPHFHFQKRENELAANHLFFLRVVFLICAVLAFIPPALMLGTGEKLVEEIEESGKWWSIQGLTEAEFQKLENPFVCASPKTGDCPNNAVSNSLGTQCLSFHSHHRTYDEAVKVCAQTEGGLASIKSQEDNDQVLKWCKDDSPCWIGLIRSKDNDWWDWADGSVIIYQNWFDYHPMNKFENNDYGAVGVFGFKRWAAKMMVVGGTAGLIMVGIEFVLVLVLCGVTYKALVAKSEISMWSVAAADAFQAFLFLLLFIFMIVGLSQSVGSGIAGGVIGILMVLMMTTFVCYLAYMGCRMKMRIEAENRTE